ncbi:DUF1361 domain-containing protein [Streptococcus sp. HF-1907]|uniref:DUF1361 domain-containing protein n=1 Tax=Streptococcus sp. HF-1907 TaxID=2785793 RepID=UPI0018A005DE|nr:DUF1361 domain-containing protein [Streptococcus sp. HF-1907]MBF7095030.1 DUF1361 domain-containing protein [Streptococcus sp. HF-1907]
MTKKLAMIHLFFVIIAAGIQYYQLTGPDLIWNMFLALLALDFAVLAQRISAKILKYIFSLAWLFFYPNTFYMLTDIVHMNFVSTVLTDRYSLILYLLYVASILFGVFSGVESVRIMLREFPIKNTWLRWFLISALSFVSSFAIHIGRYARLNSWDIVTRPSLVVKELLEVVSWNAVHFVLGFTFLQIMCLIFTDVGNSKKEIEK